MANVQVPLEMYPNVVDGRGGRIDPSSERVFLERFFHHLKSDPTIPFDDLVFVVHRRRRGEFRGKVVDLQQGAENKLLILLSDERDIFPVEEFSSYLRIFRNYGNPAGGDSRIHWFPIPYFDAVGTKVPVPFEQREINVFFSGCLNRNRIDLFKQFHPLKFVPTRNISGRYARELARRLVEKWVPLRQFNSTYPNSIVAFTKWFGQGLDPQVYADTLANTKIALCPPGFVSNETIRHWEAMRMGCVIISAPLPENRFYQGSPIIQLDDWSKLHPLLTRLLADPMEIEARHHAMVSWWNSMCSEKAVAKYVAATLLST